MFANVTYGNCTCYRYPIYLHIVLHVQTCHSSKLSGKKMPPPFCLDGALKIIVLLLFLVLVLPFLVNFKKVTHFKRPMIRMFQEFMIEKRTHGNNEEEGNDKTCFSPPLSDHPISSLAAVASLPPPSPPNSSCTIPSLPSTPSCQDPAFTGKLLARKRKIVHMILFSFEVTLVPSLVLL